MDQTLYSCLFNTYYVFIITSLYQNKIRLPLQSSRTGEQDEFVDNWIGAHIQDCDSIIKKPLLITEFGKSSKFPGFSLEERNKFFKRVYDVIYDSARTGGSCTGGVFWQLTTNRTGLLGDGYEVFMQQGPNTTLSLSQSNLLN